MATKTQALSNHLTSGNTVLSPNSIHVLPPTNLLHGSFGLHHQVQMLWSRIPSMPLQMFSQVAINHPLWSAHSYSLTLSQTPKTPTPEVATYQGPPALLSLLP